jgi:hypothetical protein
VSGFALWMRLGAASQLRSAGSDLVLLIRRARWPHFPSRNCSFDLRSVNGNGAVRSVHGLGSRAPMTIPQDQNLRWSLGALSRKHSPATARLGPTDKLPDSRTEFDQLR